MKITAREKKFLMVGGAVAAVALVVYLGVILVPSPADLSSTVERRRQALLKQREILSREDHYRMRIDQYRQRLKQDTARLLPGDNPSIAAAELQKVLKEMADKSGLEVSRRDTRREQKLQEGLVKVTVYMDTGCQPEQLVQFLAAVENYDRFLTVDELTVTAYRMGKKVDIRPGITISGFIPEGEAKPGEKPAGGQ